MLELNCYSLKKLNSTEIMEFNGGSGLGSDLFWCVGWFCHACSAFAGGAADQRGMLPH